MRQRTINKIGKLRFGFDYLVEKNVYSYLWGLRVTKELDDSLKFNSHKDWKQYIYNKYACHETEYLMEFSKYLNQRIRHVKPDRKYWDILVPILLSLMVSKMYDIIVTMPTWKWEDMPFLVAIIVLLFMGVIIVCPMIYVTYQLLGSLYDNEMDENLLSDYKEIIDNIILDKEENTKNAHR